MQTCTKTENIVVGFLSKLGLLYLSLGLASIKTCMTTSRLEQAPMFNQHNKLRTCMHTHAVLKRDGLGDHLTDKFKLHNANRAY